MKNQKLGLTINEVSKNKVSLTRMTLESQIDVTIEDGQRRDYKIQTGIKFLITC